MKLLWTSGRYAIVETIAATGKDELSKSNTNAVGFVADTLKQTRESECRVWLLRMAYPPSKFADTTPSCETMAAWPIVDPVDDNSHLKTAHAYKWGAV